MAAQRGKMQRGFAVEQAGLDRQRRPHRGERNRNPAMLGGAVEADFEPQRIVRAIARLRQQHAGLLQSLFPRPISP